MHSGVVFWGEKTELRQMMTTLEQADVQVQMFHREVGGWALHVNFAGAEISRLRLECDRLRERNFALNAALHAQRDSFEDPGALRADLARALPVVEAAGALVEVKNGIVRLRLPLDGVELELFDALAATVRAAREPRTREQR